MEIDTLSYARKNSALSSKTLPWLPHAVWHKLRLQKPGIISAAVRAYTVQCHNKWDKDIFLLKNKQIVELFVWLMCFPLFFFLKSLRKKTYFYYYLITKGLMTSVFEADRLCMQPGEHQLSRASAPVFQRCSNNDAKTASANSISFRKPYWMC